MRRVDLPSAVAVGAGGVGLVAALAFLRFCGEVTVPAKPPPPPEVHVSPEQVNEDLKRTSDVYLQAVTADARRVGLPAPTADEMTRAFRFVLDEQRHVLAPGAPPVEMAGLRLSVITHRLEGSETLLSLVIENPGPAPRAYHVDTRISSGRAPCQNRTLISHNGNVIAPGESITRSECAYKRGMELTIDRVETAELPALSAVYLSLVPPGALGIDDKGAGAHRPKLPPGIAACSVAMPQSVRSAIEDGETSWRDLVDFYARHPCRTYQFPDGYHAFTKDGERTLPAVDD